MVGAVQIVLSDASDDAVDGAHSQADSLHRSLGGHLAVQPVAQIPSILVDLSHRRVGRSWSHGRCVSWSRGEVVLLQQGATVVQCGYHIHCSECPAIDP